MFSGSLGSWKHCWVDPFKFLNSLLKLFENEKQVCFLYSKNTVTMPYIQPNFGISWHSDPKSVGITDFSEIVSAENMVLSASRCSFHLVLKYSITINIDILKERKGGKHIRTAWLTEFLTSTHNTDSPQVSEEFFVPVFRFFLHSGPALPHRDFNSLFKLV